MVDRTPYGVLEDLYKRTSVNNHQRCLGDFRMGPLPSSIRSCRLGRRPGRRMENDWLCIGYRSSRRVCKEVEKRNLLRTERDSGGQEEVVQVHHR